MIREIGEENFKDLDSIVSHIRETTSIPLPDNYEDMTRTGMRDDKVVVYGSYIQDNEINGIAIFARELNRIRFVFAHGNSEIERKLMLVLFERFSKECPYLFSSGTWITEGISKHLIEVGLTEHPRAHMSIERSVVENLAYPVLQGELNFQPYTKSVRDAVVDLSVRCHLGQDDTPFGRVDRYEGIEPIEAGVYGEFRDGVSWILQDASTIIGCSIIVIRNETGYIADIVVDPKYQGQGLGRGLLVHSMKNLVDSDSKIMKIDLDVTLTNPAINLYKSMGFERVSDWSVYTWIK